jgi:hypothetical protein
VYVIQVLENVGLFVYVIIPVPSILNLEVPFVPIERGTALSEVFRLKEAAPPSAVFAPEF